MRLILIHKDADLFTFQRVAEVVTEFLFATARRLGKTNIRDLSQGQTQLLVMFITVAQEVRFQFDVSMTVLSDAIVSRVDKHFVLTLTLKQWCQVTKTFETNITKGSWLADLMIIDKEIFDFFLKLVIIPFQE